MISRLAKYFVLTALVLTTGAHWAALQTVAWTTMLASNLRSCSVAEAVADTFDGRHPCPLCKAIAAAKKSGKKSEAVSPVLKMEFPPAAKGFVFISPKPVAEFSSFDLFAASTFPRPPVPPPRDLPV